MSKQVLFICYYTLYTFICPYTGILITIICRASCRNRLQIIVAPSQMNDELQVKEASVLRRCAFKFGVHLCSHVGLVSLVVVYTLLGAVIFAFIEGDHHVEERGLIQHSREECLKELWTITG